ncbi:hypothetical protein SDC9_189264 [bioreactor metagenome]|uniref:Uncharacterized protein n=1 Tax=bioreactor metagenome TaxID=1076179 RepID=A0A645HU42_9ZZZZ
MLFVPGAFFFAVVPALVLAVFVVLAVFFTVSALVSFFAEALLALFFISRGAASSCSTVFFAAIVADTSFLQITLYAVSSRRGHKNNPFCG